MKPCERADLSRFDRSLKETGIFKQITGNDLVEAEHKYKGPFSFRSFAKLIFSCNVLPPSPEDTVAF